MSSRNSCCGGFPAPPEGPRKAADADRLTVRVWLVTDEVDDGWGRWSRRVSTILDADETLRELNETIVRMNRTLDEFDGVLSGFTVALQDFVHSVEGFDRVVERMDGNLMPRVDLLVARAESILTGAAIPALGAQVVSSLRRSVAGVASVAGVRHRPHGDEG